MSIESEIARITEAVSDQTELIGQIVAALEGKAAGGGSGGYKSGDIVKAVDSGKTVVDRIGVADNYKYGTEVTVTDNKIYVSDAIELKANSVEDLEILRGKYLCVLNSATLSQTGEVYYIPEDTEFTVTTLYGNSIGYSSKAQRLFILG